MTTKAGADATATSADPNQLIAERREKLAALRRQGVPFPNDFKPRHHAAELHHRWGKLPNEELEPQAIPVAVAGRMMLKRVMGKACFATLQDGSFGDTHGRIQLYITQDLVGADTLAAFKHWDLGDILGCEGTLFRTKTGELSVKATSVRLLTKSLRPLPDKFHGMTRPGAEVPPALCGPDHRRDRARPLRGPQQGHQLDPQPHGRARLPGGGNADAAPDPGRRQCQALRHPPQRARPADVPAHRARAVPEAAGGGRLRARVRDQSQLPQRRHLRPAQPRIHDDGVLCGLLEPSRHDGFHRRRAAPCGAPGHRLGRAELRRQDHRPGPGLHAAERVRSAGGACRA